MRSSNSCKCGSQCRTHTVLKSMSPTARLALTVRMQVGMFRIQSTLSSHLSPLSVGTVHPVSNMSKTHLLPAAQTIERLTNDCLSPYFALLRKISQLANPHDYPFIILHFIHGLHVFIPLQKYQQRIRNIKPHSPRRLRPTEKRQSYYCSKLSILHCTCDVVPNQLVESVDSCLKDSQRDHNARWNDRDRDEEVGENQREAGVLRHAVLEGKPWEDGDTGGGDGKVIRELEGSPQNREDRFTLMN